MEKLITRTMLNPTPDNVRKLLAYDRMHPMASCALPLELYAVLAQHKREAA